VLLRNAVVQDDSQSDRWIYDLSPAGRMIGQLAFTATDPRSANLRSALREHLLSTFRRLGSDSGRAKASADAVYDLEARLAAGRSPGDQPRRMGLAELSALTPAIDWNRYFRQVGVTGIDAVRVSNPKFFQTLDAVLRTASIEDWKDYLRFSLVRLNAPFLDDGTFGEFFAFKSTATGQVEPPPRWQRVVFEEKNWLGLPLAPLFGEQYFPNRTVARYQALGEVLRQAFRDRIEPLDWMSDRTKQAALVKLARLKITIGIQANSIDFSTMPIQRDSYALNMNRLAEWFHDQEIKKLSTAVDRTQADLHPGIAADAEYDYHNNEVRISSLTGVTGLPDEALDDAFVYARTPLGHEIAHSLDSEGRQYDASGNKVEWWTTQDAAAFNARSQVLVDQYNAFTTVDGRQLDGRASLAENMADLVGLRIRLDAFKKTDQFKRNDRVGGFTPLQRFFLAYAYGYRGSTGREGVGRYAPDRLRVNGVVVNIPEFYEAFDVRPGDPMYRAESARVKIW